MSRHDISPFRFVVIGALLMTPTALLLVGLALAGRIGWSGVVAALILTGGMAVLILRTVLHDARLIAEHVDRLAETEVAVPPPVSATGTGQSLLSGIARLHAAWLARVEEMQGRLRADEAVLEALHDPLVLVDSDRRVDLANAAARGLFGDAMAGRDLAVTLRAPAVLDAVDAVLAGGASRSVEFTLPVPVERVMEARVKPFPRPLRSGARRGAAELVAMLSLHDITTIKRSEQMRADFVANASHELRTPLSTLIGFVETLRGPARDDVEAHDRFLAIMHDQASRMSRLVSDLLSLSRIELDEHTPPTGQADVARIVRTVVAMLELKAAARKIRLRVEGPDALPPVAGDEDQLTQVFQNLIDNAVKYTREGTEVTVALSVAEGPAAAAGGRRPAKLVAVSVADRGEGIPRIHLPRLTERFYRVDAARSRAVGGTGLGLAIVKHIVNRHRGRLSIDSTVGQGSTFTVHLPAAEEARRAGAEEARRAGAGESAA
ncbi:MAG TPA: ATP-binding protein [Azospirillaceae bacterium]|nr:ATP-binding protein [Azospirillaceae bacterium]